MATTNAIIPTTTLNSIANAIKAKDSGGNMTAAQMADRIAAISTDDWTPPDSWRGKASADFDATATYKRGDFVRYNNSLWICKIDLYESGTTRKTRTGAWSADDFYEVHGLDNEDDVVGNDKILIDKILAADNLYGGAVAHGFSSAFQTKYIALLFPDSTGYSSSAGTAGIRNSYSDEGASIFGSSGWVPTTYGYHWVIMYSTVADGMLFINIKSSQFYQGGRAYCWLVSNGVNRAANGFQGIFCAATRLHRIDNFNLTIEASTTSSNAPNYSAFQHGNLSGGFKDCTITLTDAGNTYSGYLFQSCRCKELPEIDYSPLLKAQGVIGSCYCLEKVQDVFDFSNATVCTNLFNSCTSLKNFPSVIVVNPDCTASYTVKALSINIAPACIAKFDAEGNIVGGFAAFATVGGKSSTYTGDSTYAPNLTLNTYVKNTFTATQVTAIETAMTNNGWTISYGT